MSFRQRCVIEKSGLFLLGRSREDTAHRGATDVEAAGDLGFAQAGAAQFADIIGVHGCSCRAAKPLAALPGMSESSPPAFS
ncbi:MAG: hypothetical protein WB523_05735 [Candidatus Sulfotelmatobacter sp.]